MRWNVEAMGNVRGCAYVDGKRARVSPGSGVEAEGTCLELVAEDGKFGDSEDSFVYAYTKLDPEVCNFALTAEVVAKVHEGIIDQQSGFGIVVSDTAASEDARCRHRNHVLLGCYGRKRVMGVRVVWGYSDPRAIGSDGVRKVDSSRVFKGAADVNPFETSMRLSLEKTDEGLVAKWGDKQVMVPGCDYLVSQDAHAVCVGFAVARGVRMSVRDVVFRESPGTLSKTPEGSLVAETNQYPFPRAVVDTERRGQLAEHVTLHVSPDALPGGDGGEDAPISLAQAVRIAGPGTRVLLQDGVYRVEEPLVVPAWQNGRYDAPVELCAMNPRKSVVDGSGLDPDQPLLVLAGSHWHVQGIVFQSSPQCGVTVMGSLNRMEDCEARENGDTGMLVIAPPDEPKASWPQGNFLVDCESHHNHDTFGTNADGFGAKMRVGEDNVFYRCTAYANADDGFDLYTKSTIGPISPVELDSCISFDNGRVSASLDGEGVRRCGFGFKLGGERQQVPHEVWNCVAFRNAQGGIALNSNPLPRISYCSASSNGNGLGDDFCCDSAFLGNLGRAAVPKTCNRALTKQVMELIAQRLGDENALGGVRETKIRHGAKAGADIGRRKKILVLISSLGGGGAERVACRLATQLSEHNDVWLMNFAQKEETYRVGDSVNRIDASYERSLETLSLPGLVVDHVRRRLNGALSVTKARREIGFDTTVSFMSSPNRLNSVFGGVRKVMSERNDPSQKPSDYFKRARWCYRHADYVVFQSRRVQGMFAERIRQKSCIIANPVEVDCMAASTRKPKVVNVARLIDQKNHELLLRAFALFHATHQAYQLHLYGEGELEENLKRLACELGIGECTHFEGFRDDVHEAISDAEMFVLSSDYEGLSNALIEAMLMGIACISTACTGSDELITDGYDGLLVPVRDVQAMAAAMARISDDEQLRVRLEEHARNRAFEFAPENIVRKWERII